MCVASDRLDRFNLLESFNIQLEKLLKESQDNLFPYLLKYKFENL